MYRNTLRSFWLLVPVALAASCSSGSTSQPISGKLALDTFDGPVATVRASRLGANSIVAPVAADGSFALTLPRGKHYRLEFVGPSGAPRLVYPRHAGSIDSWFDVRGGGRRFDLGMVRYIGDPKDMPIAFTRVEVSSDVDCENGRDKKTGAVCVDDDNDENESCGDDDDGDNDDVECENGKDAKTGLACEDGGSSSSSPTIVAVAVADHNVPAVIGGCDDENEDDDDKDEQKGRK